MRWLILKEKNGELDATWGPYDDRVRTEQLAAELAFEYAEKHNVILDRVEFKVEEA